MPRPVRARTAKQSPVPPRARKAHAAQPHASQPHLAPRPICCASCGAGVRAAPSSFRRPWLIHVLPIEAEGEREAGFLQFVLHTDCRDLFPSLSSVDSFLREKLRSGERGALR